MCLKLQDHVEQWCKVNMTVYLSYKMIHLKVIGHSIGLLSY